MMKRFVALLFGVCLMGWNGAQAQEKAEKEIPEVEKTLFERIMGKTARSRNLSVDLNTRLAFYVGMGEAEKGATFRADYLRLQVNARITDWITVRWYQHLNKSFRTGSVDGMPASVDCLGVGFEWTPTLSSFIGKQYADFGGFEYDADPAEVYEYSDFGNEVTCFLLGANLMWQVTPTQELRVQVVDGRSDSAEETYGVLPAGFRAAKVPLGYTLNWNGAFCGERLTTRCSFTAFHEGRGENVWMGALGAAWREGRFGAYVDVMGSAEGIDKLGLLSEVSQGTETGARATDCGYVTVVSRLDFRPLPKLNVFVKGSYETAGLYRAGNGMERGNYRRTWGVQGGVEYFPMTENLRFFARYGGKEIRFTDRALAWGVAGRGRHGVSFGVLYKIPVF